MQQQRRPSHHAELKIDFVLVVVVGRSNQQGISTVTSVNFGTPPSAGSDTTASSTSYIAALVLLLKAALLKSHTATLITAMTTPPPTAIPI
mmetsp:Transcript_10872/g.17808  ORF Transcript_10872/g.17808 Transcript_10872/m.17808 type:complete len:91 (-) Transcript_10872:1130-1402(-)